MRCLLLRQYIDDPANRTHVSEIGRSRKYNRRHTSGQVLNSMDKQTLMLRKGMFILAAALTVSGCTYQTVAVNAVPPGDEIETERFRNLSVDYSVEIDEQFATIESRRIGGLCGAHNFPLSVEPALTQTIDSVLEHSFANPRRHDSPQATASSDDSLVIQFKLDSLESTLGYSSGVWTGSAHADVAMNISYAIFAADGTEISRSTVSGDGSTIRGGGCSQGSVALADSATQAIEEAVQTFVYKALNSPALDSLIPVDAALATNSADEM